MEHQLCHSASHSLSQRKDSDSEISEFCLQTEEANNTSGDGDSSEDSFPSLSFSRRLGPQSPHCVLHGRHNGPLVRLIVSRMHVKTRRLKPFFVAFWQSRGADLHPEDTVMVFWSFDEMVCLHSLHFLHGTLFTCSEIPLVTWLAAGYVDVEAGLVDPHVNLGTGLMTRHLIARAGSVRVRKKWDENMKLAHSNYNVRKNDSNVQKISCGKNKATSYV